MRTRGFTLPEVLVVLFLGLIVLGLMAQLLVPSLLMFRVQAARADVQQAPLTVIHHLQRALMNAQIETVTTVGPPTAVSWTEVAEEAPFHVTTGRPRHRPAFSCLWHDPVQGLVWTKQWPPGPPSLAVDFASKDPPQLTGADLRAVCASRNGTERVLARDVWDVRVSGDEASGSLLVLPLHLSVTCAVRSGARNEGVESLTLTARVSPRSVRW